MVQRRGHRRFAQQLCASVGSGERGIGDPLERDPAAEARILGQVDDAHPAGAQALDDPVRAYPRLHVREHTPSRAG